MTFMKKEEKRKAKARKLEKKIEKLEAASKSGEKVTYICDQKDSCNNSNICGTLCKRTINIRHAKFFCNVYSTNYYEEKDHSEQVELYCNSCAYYLCFSNNSGLGRCTLWHAHLRDYDYCSKGVKKHED